MISIHIILHLQIVSSSDYLDSTGRPEIDDENGDLSIDSNGSNGLFMTE